MKLSELCREPWREDKQLKQLFLTRMCQIKELSKISRLQNPEADVDFRRDGKSLKSLAIPHYLSLSFGYISLSHCYLLAIFWLSFGYLSLSFTIFYYLLAIFGYPSLSFTILWLSFANLVSLANLVNLANLAKLINLANLVLAIFANFAMFSIERQENISQKQKFSNSFVSVFPEQETMNGTVFLVVLNSRSCTEEMHDLSR